MTKYCGGKKKISSYIYDTIRDIEDQFIDNGVIKTHLDYLEPFCGMCSIAMEFAMEQDDDNDINRKIVVSDFNDNITKFWKGLKNGDTPPKFISENEYNKLKNKNGSSFVKTYAGFDWSFGGGWFAGYLGRYHTASEIKKIGLGCYNKMQNLKPLMDYITVKETTNYKSYNPHNKIIYLDPPYLGTKKSTNNDFLKEFDHNEFWDTATKWSKDNIVFISEVKTNIPKKYKDKYTVVWSAKTHRSVSKVKGKSKMECLFLHNSWAKLYNDDESDESDSDSDDD